MMKKKRKLRKDRVISTFIPLIIIIVLGGIIGNKMIIQNDKNENIINNSNQINYNEQLNIMNESNNQNQIDKESNSLNTELLQNNISSIQKDEKENVEVKKTDENEKKDYNKNTNVQFDETVAFI